MKCVTLTATGRSTEVYITNIKRVKSHCCLKNAVPSRRQTVVYVISFKQLRRNPPQVRVTSGQKRSTKGINITNPCATALNIFTKEVISNNIKCQKEHLKFI